MLSRSTLAWKLAALISTGLLWATATVVADEVTKAPAEAKGPTYQLRYKFEKGEVVQYESVQSVKFISQFKDTVETASNRTETKKKFRVLDVHADGSADLELVIDWVRMKARFSEDDPGLEFDSSDPGAKSQAKFRDVLKNVGKPQAHLKCSSTGKVLKVTDLSLLSPTPTGSRPVQLKDVSGQDDFNFLTVLPAEPIAVGGSWKEKSEIKVVAEDNLKVTVQLQRIYTLSAVEGNQATISFRTSVLTPINNSTISIQLIQRETFGKLIFDMERGNVVSRSIESDKSIISPVGPNTAMHSTSTFIERIVTSTADISDNPTTATKRQ